MTWVAALLAGLLLLSAASTRAIAFVAGMIVGFYALYGLRRRAARNPET